MSIAIAVLAVSFTVSAVLNFLTLVAVGNSRRDHNEIIKSLCEGHNWTASRINEFSELFKLALDLAAQQERRAASSTSERGA